MTADEISKLIESAMSKRGDITTIHGLDLERCLVTPHRGRFANPETGQSDLDLWLVLEEDPINRSGYKIVFDERTKMFGLAVADIHSGPTFIGAHGSFLEALEAM